MIKQLTIALAAAAMLAPLSAQAGEVHNRVNNEQARINQGVRSGQVTRGEYSHLENRLDTINSQRRADLAANGGKLTGSEYHQLNREENHLSNNIYFDKHNLNRQP